MSANFSSDHKRMILFDLNGTLIDEKATKKAAFIEALTLFTGRWSSDEPHMEPAQVHRMYEKEFLKARRQKPSFPARKLRQTALKKALRAYPVPSDNDFADAFFRTVAKQKKEQIRLYPDAVQTLEALSKKYELRIISNSRGYQISRSPLSAFFKENDIFTPEQAGRRKPDPRFYQAALKKWNVQPSECIMVGNSWKNDIVGAAKAGIDGIWIRKRQRYKLAYRKINRKKVIVIRSLQQLPAVIP